MKAHAGSQQLEAPPGSEAKVLWHVTMSLDGFIAGPGDSMSWAFGHASGPNAAVGEVVRTTGAILAGRRWYELAHDDPDAAPYGGAWSGPIMVMTHRPPEPSPDAAPMRSSGQLSGPAPLPQAAATRDSLDGPGPCRGRFTAEPHPPRLRRHPRPGRCRWPERLPGARRSGTRAEEWRQGQEKGCRPRFPGEPHVACSYFSHLHGASGRKARGTGEPRLLVAALRAAGATRTGAFGHLMDSPAQRRRSSRTSECN